MANKKTSFMRRISTALSIILLLIFAYSCSTESTPVYQLNTAAEPSEAGSVTQSATEADEGETITITANTNQNWVFSGWSGDHSGSENPASVVMNRDKSVTALFEKREYPLTVITEGEGTVGERIIQQKTTDYAHGTVVELTAIPTSNWVFAGWSGDFSGMTNPFELTINSNKTIVATFERQLFDLDVTIEGDGFVNKELLEGTLRDGKYAYESIVKLQANPNSGYVFDSWKGDYNSSNNSIEILIDRNVSINAVFKQGVIDIDGNFYQTVKIGNQWWMAENLRTTRYQNGNQIPNVSDNQDWRNTTFGAWAYYNNDSQFNSIYGKLYNWYAATDNRNICPVGWRTPSDHDLSILANHLGQNAGGKLKTTGFQFWKNPNSGATNESGFSALPSGGRSINGDFSRMGERAYVWSSTESDTENAFYRILEYNSGNFIRNDFRKKDGRPIRCIIINIINLKYVKLL
ncbi:MAG: fibrobacter succinogenes major paralogous domain-containing protein [Balneolaceae bacterium]|nr:fibrobacter succinogenes major paralogous domain-containing protein [Balneolaceae bacterium]